MQKEGNCMQRARMAILLATMLIASMIVGAGIAVAAAATVTVTPDDTTITVGDTTNATATLASSTATTGTLTIALFSDNTCTTAVGGVTQDFPTTGDGSFGPLTSPTGYTTTTVGSVWWKATYVGDGSDDSASTCVEVAVAQATPTVTTTPDPTSVDPAPGDLSDTATLAGGYNATGTITFKLFPPADPTCAGTEVYSEAVTVNGDDDYSTAGTGTGSVSGNLAGTWHWTADYSGDTNNAAKSSLCADETVDVYVDTSVIYAGQTFDSDGGGTSILSANLASIDPVCLSGNVTFTLTDAGGGTVGPFIVANVSPSTSVTSPPETIPSGIYEVDVAFDPTNAFCNPSSDFAVLSVVSPGDAANGGGWYKNADFTPPRINFGFTVQKQYNRKTDVTTYRGQLLWMNTGAWRLKGTIFSVSPDPAAYGTFPCPTTVGSAGPPSSNPKCGSFMGSGVLQIFDDTANGGLGGWVDSTYGTVTFTATVYDGGTISVCKGKKNCTKQDLADWFGIQIDPVPNTVVPESAPIQIMKGSIKVS
jgi:hypothetical protein